MENNQKESSGTAMNREKTFHLLLLTLWKLISWRRRKDKVQGECLKRSLANSPLEFIFLFN